MQANYAIRPVVPFSIARKPSVIELDKLLRNNREWAERIRQEDPGFFERLSQQQSPRYLWIGWSD